MEGGAMSPIAERIMSRPASVLAITNAIERFTPASPLMQKSPPRVRVETERGVARQVH